jgi:hypothetical protein
MSKKSSGSDQSVKKLTPLFLGAAVVVLIIVVAVFFAALRHWLAVHTGTINESGPFYGFWSGFGSDLGEGAIAVGVYTGARKVNCHAKGCWRIGHHQLEGTPYHLCKFHHPGVPKGGAKLEDILAAGKKYQDDQAAQQGGTAPSS